MGRRQHSSWPKRKRKRKWSLCLKLTQHPPTLPRTPLSQSSLTDVFSLSFRVTQVDIKPTTVNSLPIAPKPVSKVVAESNATHVEPAQKQKPTVKSSQPSVSQPQQQQ